MDKLRQELSSLHIEKALDIATRDGAFAKEMYAGFGSCKEIWSQILSGCPSVTDSDVKRTLDIGESLL